MSLRRAGCEVCVSFVPGVEFLYETFLSANAEHLAQELTVRKSEMLIHFIGTNHVNSAIG
jgi:hypothetical protein